MGQKKRTFFSFIIFCSLLSFLARGESASDNDRFRFLELFSKVINLIETQYYQEVKIKGLVEGAIKGMLDVLDAHSTYLPEELYSQMKIDTQGEFFGIGVEVIIKDNAIMILSVMEGSPAMKAGLKAQDKIIKINNENVFPKKLEDVLIKMKGKLGESVSVSIKREEVDKLLDFKIKREVVKIDPVKEILTKDGLLVVKIHHFQKGVSEELQKTLKNYLSKKSSKKIKGVLLDLRNNPGGLLDEAVKMAAIFIEEGAVVHIEGKDSSNLEARYIVRRGEKYLTIPLVALINGSSASASEILVGALQDYERATVVGSRSFGKGTVQTLVELNEKSGLKLTVAQYLTPKKRRIQARGIIPDIELDQFELTNDDIQKKKQTFLREEDLRKHLENKDKVVIEKNEEEDKKFIIDKRDLQLHGALAILKAVSQQEK